MAALGQASWQRRSSDGLREATGSVLDHPYDDDDEDDPHENPDPNRYVHLFHFGERSIYPKPAHPREPVNRVRHSPLGDAGRAGKEELATEGESE